MKYTVITHKYHGLRRPPLGEVVFDVIGAKTAEQAVGRVLASWWASVILADVVSVSEDGRVTLRVSEDEAENYEGKQELVYKLPEFVELCGTEDEPRRFARLIAAYAGTSLVEPFEGATTDGALVFEHVDSPVPDELLSTAERRERAISSGRSEQPVKRPEMFYELRKKRISKRNLLCRVKRKLAQEFQGLRTWRSDGCEDGHSWEAGDMYRIVLERNRILDYKVNLEKLAAELGVIGANEELSST